MVMNKREDNTELAIRSRAEGWPCIVSMDHPSLLDYGFTKRIAKTINSRHSLSLNRLTMPNTEDQISAWVSFLT